MDSSEEKMWYFAYGSNMNPKVLTGRRKVEPTNSVAAFAPKYYLNFYAVLMPYLEPSFASVGPRPILPNQPVVHGVAHEITKREFAQIRRTEGGGGHDGVGYNIEDIEVETYDGKKLITTTLVHCSDETRLLFPSVRYLKLIENGAADFNLKPEYQDWIKSLPRYTPLSTVRHRMGRILFLSFAAIFAAPVLIIMFGGRYLGRRPPREVYVATTWVVKFVVNVYWYLFRPIFGNGAGEQQIKYKS